MTIHGTNFCLDFSRLRCWVRYKWSTTASRQFALRSRTVVQCGFQPLPRAKLNTAERRLAGRLQCGCSAQPVTASSLCLALAAPVREVARQQRPLDRPLLAIVRAFVGSKFATLLAISASALSTASPLPISTSGWCARCMSGLLTNLLLGANPRQR